MRIAIISEYVDGGGGTPTVLLNLVEHFGAHHPDLKVDILSSRNEYRGDAKLPRFSRIGPARVVRLDTPKSNRDSTLLRLLAGLCFSGAVFWRLLRACPYDALLIVTNPPTLPLAIRAIKGIKRVPFVYLVHDLYPDVAIVLGMLGEQSRGAKAFRRAQKVWLHSADRVIVLGRDMKAHLKSVYALPEERIEVVPNWGDPNAITPTRDSKFRQENDLDGVIALYSGNFGHYQTFSELLDAAKLLKDAHPEVCIVLVGGGAQDEMIRRRVEDEALSNVRVFPMQTSYPDVLAAADIALVTLARGAEAAGVPSKFYNVLSSGRPTVAVVAPRSEVALVLKEEECGVQINHDDAPTLAQALVELAASPEKRERMGRNARRALEEKYTIAPIASRLKSALAEVARGGKR